MSSFYPSPAELGLVSQIFASADPQKIGIVTGDAAVKVFAGAKLSPTVLGEVWAIADKENEGYLTRKGVAIALRLIGHAQKGEAVDEALLSKRVSSCWFVWLCCVFLIAGFPFSFPISTHRRNLSTFDWGIINSFKPLPQVTPSRISTTPTNASRQD